MRNTDKLSYIGVIGDVHSEDRLLQLAVKFLKEKNVEKIFCVGDIADGKGDINECCNILKKERIISVLGNHDRWLLSNTMRTLKDASVLNQLSEHSKNFLKSLPVTVEFCTSHGDGLLCHGLENNDMARVTPDDYGYSIEVNADLQKIIREQKYKYIINGHTHYRMMRKFEHLTIVNAGTLKREQEPCFLIINFATKTVKFFDFIENGLIEEKDDLCF